MAAVSSGTQTSIQFMDIKERATVIVGNTRIMRRIDTKAYLSSQSSCKMFSKVSTILLSTGICAGIGAAVGSMECGIGAAPGAGIGAVVGLGVGIGAVSSWTSCEFKNWKESQSKEVVSSTLRALNGLINDPELICPITLEPPTDPVVTPNSKQVFGREALEEHIRKNGTDPITRQKLTLKEVYHAPAAMGALNNVCRTVTQGPMRQNFAPDELEGVEMLGKDLDKNIKTYLKAEEKILIERIEKKEISIRDAGDAFQRLCYTLDPRI